METSSLTIQTALEWYVFKVYFCIMSVFTSCFFLHTDLNSPFYVKNTPNYLSLVLAVSSKGLRCLERVCGSSLSLWDTFHGSGWAVFGWTLCIFLGAFWVSHAPRKLSGSLCLWSSGVGLLCLLRTFVCSLLLYRACILPRSWGVLTPVWRRGTVTSPLGEVWAGTAVWLL